MQRIFDDDQQPSMVEKHSRYMNPILADDITFVLQAMLVVVGFYWSLRIMQRSQPGK